MVKVRIPGGLSARGGSSTSSIFLTMARQVTATVPGSLSLLDHSAREEGEKGRGEGCGDGSALGISLLPPLPLGRTMAN